MKPLKNIPWAGLLVLLCACTAPAADTAHVDSTQTIVASPTHTIELPSPQPAAGNTPTTVQPSALPTQAVYLTAALLDDERAIPAGLSLPAQQTEVIRQYYEITGQGSNAWAVTGIRGGLYYLLDIRSPATGETVTLTYPVLLEIYRENIPQERANIMAPMSGGGGGTSVYFPSVPLAAGAYELMPDDTSPVILGSGQKSIFYPFDMTCQAVGNYYLLYHIPYTMTDSSGSHNLTLDYPVQISCPQQAALWLLDKNSNTLQHSADWQLSGGRYVLISQN